MIASPLVEIKAALVAMEYWPATGSSASDLSNN